MRREHGTAGLWRIWIRLYQLSMAKVLYNLRMLGDSKMRDAAFGAFLDAYATSIDIDPICYRPRRRKSAEALWADFVRVAMDANTAIDTHLSRSGKSLTNE